MTIAILNLMGTCFVRKQYVRIYFACTKRLFNLSREATFNVLNARQRVRCAVFPLKNKEFLFREVWPRDFYFDETQKSYQDVIPDVCCPTCPNEKCVHLSTNKNSSFYDCKKCKACSHVHNIPF